MVPNIIDICEEFNLSSPDNSPYKDCNSMLIYDTSGLNPKVKENTPKTLVSEINKQKSCAKATNKLVKMGHTTKFFFHKQPDYLH